MSLITAALRPSGASYRDKLMQKEFHKNPSEIIDNMLADNYGYLIYQEDTIKFLKDICGLTGSEADNIRRAIGRKQKERLDAAMPSILEGYCKMSPQPREVAEQEAKEFLQIIEDSASYQFGYNHSVAYCMIGYLCAYLRYYHTPHFIVAYLNNAQNEDDIVGGFEMAKLYGYSILPPRFRHSTDKYMYDAGTKNIYKGVASIKYLNSGAAEYLYSLRDNKYDSFIDLLIQIEKDSQINSRQMEILIKLQYFSEFGKNQKLLTLYGYFKALYERKTMAKDKLSNYNLTASDIADSYEKETEKQYSGLNYCRILENVEKRIPDTSISIQEQISFELEVVGYINAKYEVDKRYCMVLDLDLKYSPKVTLHSLGSVKQTVCKVSKAIFNETPFIKGQILKCEHFAQKFKQQKTEKGWEKTDIKEWWLDLYSIVNNIEL